MWPMSRLEPSVHEMYHILDGIIDSEGFVLISICECPNIVFRFESGVGQIEASKSGSNTLRGVGNPPYPAHGTRLLAPLQRGSSLAKPNTTCCVLPVLPYPWGRACQAGRKNTDSLRASVGKLPRRFRPATPAIPL
jgi:hypothetical protein